MMLSKSERKELTAYLDKPTDFKEMTELLAEHRSVIRELVGVPENLYVHTHLFETELSMRAFYKHKGWDDAEEMSEADGSCSWDELKYCRVHVMVHGWHIKTRREFFWVVQHEMAHAATGEVALLRGEEHVHHFVSERIIIPLSNGFQYDPIRRTLWPVMRWDEGKHAMVRARL